MEKLLIKRNKWSSPRHFHQISGFAWLFIVQKLTVRDMILRIFLGNLAHMSAVLDENTVSFSVFDGFQGFAALKLEALHFFSPLPVFRLKSTFTMHVDGGFVQSDFHSG